MIRPTSLRSMRILFLTNFYPPYSLGGMELSLHAIAKALERRGHSVFVLTSQHGVRNPEFRSDVARVLHLEMELKPLRNAWNSLLHNRRNNLNNFESVRRVIEEFDPDLVFVGGLWNLNSEIAHQVEKAMNSRVLYRFADYWPLLPNQTRLYWRERGKTWPTKVLRQLVAPLALRVVDQDLSLPLSFKNCFFVSRAVRRKLAALVKPVSMAPVIYTGIDLEPYQNIDLHRKWQEISAREVAYVGRMVREKGIEVLIRAFEHIVRASGGDGWRLKIIGSGERRYVDELASLIRRLGLSNHIVILGPVPSDRAREHMITSGVIVVPSLWDDPLPRVAIEGQASGCVVIGSDIGGIPEIIDHESTGILFPPNDHLELANSLLELESRSGMARQLSAGGRASVRERFGFKRMMDSVENLMKQAARSRNGVAA